MTFYLIQFGTQMRFRTEHRLTLWDTLADMVGEYVRRGDRIYVEGRIEYGSFEKNGVTIPTTEIVVRELVLMGRPSATTANADDEDESY